MVAIKTSVRLAVANPTRSLLPQYAVLQRNFAAGNIDGCFSHLRGWLIEHPEDVVTVNPDERAFLTDATKRVAESPNPLKQRTFQTATLVAQQLGQWKLALGVIEKSVECGYLPSGPLVAGFVDEKNWRTIHGWCAARDVPFCVSTAMGILGASQRWASALELAEMEEQRWGIGNGESYRMGVMVPHLASGGSWTAALKLFSDHAVSGAPINPVMASNMIVECAASPKGWQTALLLTPRMVRMQLLHGVDEPRVNEVFTSVAAAAADWSGSVRAMSMATGMGASPSRALVERVVGRCDEAGASNAAVAAYEHAAAAGFSGRLGNNAFVSLIRSYQVAATWERAVASLSWMADAASASMTEGLVALVEMCGEAGQWETSLKIGHEMMDAGTHLPGKTYVTLLSALADGGLWDRAMQLYGVMSKDPTVTPAPKAALPVLQSCVAEGKWMSAIAFFSNVQRDGRALMPHAGYSLAMQACQSARRWYESLVLLSMLDADGAELEYQERRLGLWSAALTGAWRKSIEHLLKLPPQTRTSSDTRMARLSAADSGPHAQGVVLRALRASQQGKRPQLSGGWGTPRKQ